MFRFVSSNYILKNTIFMCIFFYIFLLILIIYSNSICNDQFIFVDFIEVVVFRGGYWILKMRESVVEYLQAKARVQSLILSAYVWQLQSCQESNKSRQCAT